MNFLGTTTEIPDELFIQHQEGKVIFFCGAGISKGVGLPDFKDLVLMTKEKAMLPCSDEFDNLLATNQLDALYHRMEIALGGSPEDKIKLRRITASCLKTKALGAYGPNDLKVHESILKLSQRQCASDKRRKKRLHLVTTNYDNLFDLSASRIGLRGVNPYVAPLIPAPRDFRWNGIVYLHGKLDKRPNEDNLNSLVISSGDFGMAYLTERWASRFLTGLFANYTVCFIGYSANDPIIRYMMDAIAAERVLGENRNTVYAFSGCLAGDEKALKNEWSAKGIRVVPYEQGDSNDHSQLKSVLVAWSELYSAEYKPREELICRIGRINPKDNRELAKQVSRLLVWALRDNTGGMAKLFAEMEPLPSVEWFEYLDNAEDLLPLSSSGALSKVHVQMLYWLSRHVDNVELLRKIVSRKKDLSICGIYSLEQIVLKGLSARSEKGNHDKSRTCGLQQLWILWLESQRKLKNQFPFDYFDECLECSRNTGFPSSLLGILSFLVQPIVHLRIVDPEFRLEKFQADDWRRCFSASISIVSEETLLLSERGLLSRVEDFPIQCVTIFESALELTCAIREELGDEGEDYDSSLFEVPDLTVDIDHVEDVGEGWPVLVFLLKKAWKKLLAVDDKKATRMARNWFKSKHPIFRRLAISSVISNPMLDFNRTIKWLVSNPEQYLFGRVYIREVIQLIRSKGAQLTKDEWHLFSRCLSEYFDKGNARISRHCAMLIDAFKGSGVNLSEECMSFYDSYNKEHPEFQRRDNEKDGLSVWSESAVYDILDNPRAMPPMPKNDKEFSLWIARYEDARKDEVFSDDPWRRMCDEAKSCLEPLKRLVAVAQMRDCPMNALGVLITSAIRKGQGNELWHGIIKSNWKHLDEIKVNDDSRYSALLQTVGESLPNDARYLKEVMDILFNRCDVSDRVITEVMDGALRSWYATHPEQNGGIKSPYRDLFTKVACADTHQLEVARNGLLQQIVGLVAVDKEWTVRNLLPILDWKRNENDATSAWKKLLLIPRFSDRLMRIMKPYFKDTANHFFALWPYGKQYVSFLFSLATEKCGEFSALDYSDVIRALPEEGRACLADVICYELDCSKERRDSYWEEKIKPFLTECWPDGSQFFNSDIAGHILSGVVYCFKSYASAVNELIRKASGKIRLNRAISRLANPPKGTTARCKAYPEVSMRLLSCIESADVDISMAGSLRKCLNQLLEARPDMEKSPEFERLDFLVRAHNR